MFQPSKGKLNIFLVMSIFWRMMIHQPSINDPKSLKANLGVIRGAHTVLKGLEE